MRSARPAGLALVLLVAAAAAAQDCVTLDPAQWKSGCGDVSLSATRVRPGQKLTVNVSAGGGGPCSTGFKVSCSYAEPELLLDGVPVTADGGSVPMYNYDSPKPSPTGPQTVVSVPTGAHTLVFTIRADAPDACHAFRESFGKVYADGPFVSFGRGSTWSTPVPFVIDAEEKIDVTLAAASPLAGQAKPEQTIAYTVTADAGLEADEIVVKAKVPAGTDLLPETVTAQGNLVAVEAGLLTWRFADTAQAQVSYSVRVFDLGHKKLAKLDRIKNRASGAARFKKNTVRDADAAELELIHPEPGKLRYVNINGQEDGRVVVGQPITVIAEDWDADYGPVTVIYQGETVGEFAPPTEGRQFEVPSFERDDLKSELVATQKSLERKKQLKGLPEFLVALTAGEVRLVEGRRLKAGRFLAEGELDLGTAGYNLDVPEGAATAVATGPGLGVVVNRQTNIHVLGQLSARKGTVMRLAKGSAAFDRGLTPPIDLDAYDPAGREGLAILAPGEMAGGELAGFMRCAGNLTFTGPVALDGAVLFVDGHLDFQGGLSGIGAVFATRNLRVSGPVDLRTDNVQALAAGKYLILDGAR